MSDRVWTAPSLREHRRADEIIGEMRKLDEEVLALSIEFGRRLTALTSEAVSVRVDWSWDYADEPLPKGKA